MRSGGNMAALSELLDHYSRLHAQMLNDIKAWRSGGWRLVGNNEDMTERWLKDQQTRADKIRSMIAADEKPPLCVYGMF